MEDEEHVQPVQNAYTGEDADDGNADDDGGDDRGASKGDDDGGDDRGASKGDDDDDSSSSGTL